MIYLQHPLASKQIYQIPFLSCYNAKTIVRCCEKEKRKRENQFFESGRGALNKYSVATSSVNVNNNNQTIWAMP
jgi:hypothetical protein